MLVLGRKPEKTALEKDEFNIDWMLQGPEVTLEMKKDIMESLADYQFKIPKNIVSYIIAHYNYSPYSKNKFDANEHKGVQFKYFLDFGNPMSLTSKENAYSLFKYFRNNEDNIEGISPFEEYDLYPIATTINDGLLCTDSKGVIHLYYLDSDEVVKVANTFDEFLASLYISNEC
uniref:Syd, a SecY-interacting protein n=1 Tax=Myoviridae sp. ctIty1 TaxID=2827673 RepID=A0A8S5TH67_9CAUD|nr:MAG TPA: Syd, a SecY-interacting protein [Myoviridae sp. ctIty1]